MIPFFRPAPKSIDNALESGAVEPGEIRNLLTPFLEGEPISAEKLAQLYVHFDLLMKWNTRINLTAVRDPAEVWTRHFGESLFAARKLAGSGLRATTLIDLGSGAGFPGIPIKIWIPELYVSLVESRQKKATFLREIARTLGVPGLEIVNQRAEKLGAAVDVVTVRAVEDFESAVSIAANLLKPSGSLMLLIGSAQARTAKAILPRIEWLEPIPIPGSQARVLLTGSVQSAG